MNPRSDRVPGLDVFRSVAILCVMACHFSQCGVANGPIADQVRNFLGLCGVELFFVLSGFLIGSILIRDFSKSHVNFAVVQHFWSRRWFRTLPNYYVYLFLTLMIPGAWKYGLRVLLLYPVFLQGFAWDMHKFFIVSWSLCVEEWFYLFFPLAILLSWQFLKDARKSILAGLILFLIVPFVLRITTSSGRNWLLGVVMVVIYRIDSIAIGITLAILKNYQIIWSRLVSPFVLMVGSILFACLLVYSARSGGENISPSSAWYNGLFFSLLNISAALMLPWFAALRRVREPFLCIFTWISILSYSLYLSHVAVMDFSAKVFYHLGIIPSTPLKLITWICGSVLLASITYRFVELPFLRLRESRGSVTSIAPPPKRCDPVA